VKFAALTKITNSSMKNVLILCTGNSCRSQIAHGYFEHFTDGRSVRVYSAGVETHGVNPRAIATMAADGIDISGNTSNHIDEYMDIRFDLIFTVCDNAVERCPIFPFTAKKVHFNFPDPAKAAGTEAEIAAEFAAVRDQIKAYVEELAREL
jgi:arsenate reductase (thioredoxin)